LAKQQQTDHARADAHLAGARNGGSTHVEHAPADRDHGHVDQREPHERAITQARRDSRRLRVPSARPSRTQRDEQARVQQVTSPRWPENSATKPSSPVDATTPPRRGADRRAEVRRHARDRGGAVGAARAGTSAVISADWLGSRRAVAGPGGDGGGRTSARAVWENARPA